MVVSERQHRLAETNAHFFLERFPMGEIQLGDQILGILHWHVRIPAPEDGERLEERGFMMTAMEIAGSVPRWGVTILPTTRIPAPI